MYILPTFKSKSSLVLCRFPSPSPAPSSFSVPAWVSTAFGSRAVFPLVLLVLPFPFGAQGPSAWPLLPPREDSLAPPEHEHDWAPCVPTVQRFCSEQTSQKQYLWEPRFFSPVVNQFVRLFPSLQNYLFLGDIF